LPKFRALAESVQVARTVAVTVNVVVTAPERKGVTVTVIVSVYVPGTTVCPAAWGYIWSVWALPKHVPDTVVTLHSIPGITLVCFQSLGKPDNFIIIDQQDTMIKSVVLECLQPWTKSLGREPATP
jgi:hypothetical protein